MGKKKSEKEKEVEKGEQRDELIKVKEDSEEA